MLKNCAQFFFPSAITLHGAFLALQEITLSFSDLIHFSIEKFVDIFIS